ncbi:MAG: YkgJ family cysteine cluster protein [Candidatus Woesearchaeota archaeon]
MKLPQVCSSSSYQEPCKKCGNCCRFYLFPPKLTIEEEYKIRKAIFEKTSILYPYPLTELTIAIMPEEKETLKKLAQELGVELKFIISKILIKKKNQESIDFEIISYCIKNSVCPFLDAKTNLCRIYPFRPKVCRDYPKEKKFQIFPDKEPPISFESAIYWFKQVSSKLEKL